MKTVTKPIKQRHEFFSSLIKRYRKAWKAIAGLILLIYFFAAVITYGDLGKQFTLLYLEAGTALVVAQFLSWYRRHDIAFYVLFFVTIGGPIELVRTGLTTIIGISYPLFAVNPSHYPWDFRFILVVGCLLWTVAFGEYLSKVEE
jgi:hypothetical protein